MIIPEYTQGEWYAIVAEGLVVMLDPSAPAALVRDSWANLRGGGGLDGQVALFERVRIDDLPDLAIVDIAGGRVRAVVRGGVEVEVIAHGAPSLLGGHTSGSLTEQVVEDVELVRVRAVPTARVDRRKRSGIHLPVLAAVVTADAVRIQLRSAATSSQVDELTIERPRVGAPAAVLGDSGRRDPNGGRLGGRRATDVPAALEPRAWPAERTSGDGARPSSTGAPARLRLSTGLVVALDRAVLLGRAPQVSRVTNAELPRLVTVASPEQDISRTHAEVRVEGDDVLVTDLHSTNGVLLTPYGEPARRLHPGEPTVLRPGAVVDLGEGVTFTVERG
ncbi:FHA domain-containing protein [Cellulomonas sp. P24]|uniref:FHA domain-containing protein n=1 Tax=Cellulomonas sp. P24 TaxID=2885206 RepID=UPI00216B5B3B|nr:FHA domain-containing protein [Cellulomonas sp. P24]MCR6494098.1 FHA domain-containing protein [Cellulomonas sp. P24]